MPRGGRGVRNGVPADKTVGDEAEAKDDNGAADADATIADGTFEPAAGDRLHLDTCPICQSRVAAARSIERLLASREALVPHAGFTANVMALVGRERWQTERVFDLGFNLAIAAGLLLILAGSAGLAWSLGFLTIHRLRRAHRRRRH